jgi:hypothetical protein
MTENFRTLDILRKPGPGGRLLPSGTQPARNELPHELQKYMHVLGPTPKRCLETLADLGLSDPKIGRCFKIPKDIVTDLRQVWKIDGET